MLSLSPVTTIIAFTMPAGAGWPHAKRWMKNELLR
jgi:hypothetical protein